MLKVAFIFPGQGAQTVGMGKDFSEAGGIANKIYQVFDANTSSDLSTICFNGPEDKLKRTLYTQPAILATSLAALALFQEKSDIQPIVTAGHSLGEYGALYASGVIDLETAAKLIHQRASLMDQAQQGAMSAVLGLPAEKVEAVLQGIPADLGPVVAANYNTPEQLIISGAPPAVEAAGIQLKEAGAKRVLPLAVGGAFHSPLMAEAATSFETFLSPYTFNNAVVPVITNVDAQPTTAGDELKAKLSKQINHSVRWTQTMDQLFTQLGVDTVIEFGPGKVLTGMIKKCHPMVQVYNVFDMTSLNATLEAMGQTVSV
ncbi:MAG: ACP S-malonyltransferase [Vampirovibrio sp.]|nr:ACP S-malonyltransferase [Vampirovibrio sp.]